MKLEDKLVIRKSREPEGKKTHILWHDSKSLGGYGCKQVLKGTYYECLDEKERLLGNVRKSKSTSFSLLRKALHNR